MATSLSPYLARLEIVRSDLVGLRPAIVAGEPWPLAEQFGLEPEASWGPPETLAHLAEMYPYWHRQLRSILAGPAGPVPFGRTQDDPSRLDAIERDRLLPAAELVVRIDASIEPLLRLLAELTDDDAARVGLHPVRGEMTIPAILERMVVGHGEEHVVQLRDALAGA